MGRFDCTRTSFVFDFLHNQVIFQPYHGGNKLHSMQGSDDVHCLLKQHA